ncbi:unnamed protein product [Ostreobium quekettii]|uniref:Large ribosomal subunit protein uL22c n=1 Tax=Ostreobium quekettii TaxID=121088 RepID=A0A8S1J337_9CHLO|nr:unnamed protein product [Ostreobium quekettii]
MGRGQRVKIAPGPSTPFPGPSTPDALRTARAIKRGVQISPKKLNLVAKLVRRMPLAEAFRQCDVIPKKAARLVREVLKSAAANAEHNHRLRRANLTVEECFVTKGTNLYRTWWHGRGKVGKRTRYYSHLTVVLREADEAGAGTGGGARVAKALMDRPRSQGPGAAADEAIAKAIEGVEEALAGAGERSLGLGAAPALAMWDEHRNALEGIIDVEKDVPRASILPDAHYVEEFEEEDEVPDSEFEPHVSGPQSAHASAVSHSTDQDISVVEEAITWQHGDPCRAFMPAAAEAEILEDIEADGAPPQGAQQCQSVLEHGAEREMSATPPRREIRPLSATKKTRTPRSGLVGHLLPRARCKILDLQTRS